MITIPSSIPGIHDAGDTVTSVMVVKHSSVTPLTCGFRLNLTVTYPTEYLYLNDSDINSTVLILNGETRLYSVSLDVAAGTVVFSTDELQTNDNLEVTTIFKLTQSVANSHQYTIDHVLDWHNLPYELPAAGRYYNTSGKQIVQIAKSQLFLSYDTSNKDTLTSDIQLQEFIYLNVTVIPPEVSTSSIKRYFLAYLNEQMCIVMPRCAHLQAKYTVCLCLSLCM